MPDEKEKKVAGISGINVVPYKPGQTLEEIAKEQEALHGRPVTFGLDAEAAEKEVEVNGVKMKMKDLANNPELIKAMAAKTQTKM